MGLMRVSRTLQSRAMTRIQSRRSSKKAHGWKVPDAPEKADFTSAPISSGVFICSYSTFLIRSVLANPPVRPTRLDLPLASSTAQWTHKPCPLRGRCWAAVPYVPTPQRLDLEAESARSGCRQIDYATIQN